MGEFQLVNGKRKQSNDIGFKEVDFFAGIRTPSPDDDRRVKFVARKRGKKSPLPRPKIARLQGINGFEGINTKLPKATKKLPAGLAEVSGLSFDKVFGLGKTKDTNPFKSKIGIDPGFGKGTFDVDFSEGFANQEFDFGESTMISDDFPEPDQIDFVGESDVDRDVPTLLDSIQQLGDDRRVPLTDEEDDMTRNEKLERKFRRVRAEALETGANPLSPEEQRSFESSTKFTRNFGTTSKKSRGAGFEGF